MRVIQYTKDKADEWDSLVKIARNSTFLFQRGFMEYHESRFEDASLMFYNEHSVLVGVIPANIERERSCVVSHGGLTYGGLLTRGNVSTLMVKEMFRLLAEFYLQQGISILLYKPTPYIYHTYPADEDLYWLFRSSGMLAARSISTAIDLHDALPFSTLRKRKVKKAARSGIHVGPAEDKGAWEKYWKILTEVLFKQHATLPVHSLEEIWLLAQKFPDNIRLYLAYDGLECVAGIVIFVCNEVAHAQYIATSDEGRISGALDLLFEYVINLYKLDGKRFFDFGISTEHQGEFLNEGLIFQKEGFGGRGVCYDSYSVDLHNLLLI